MARAISLSRNPQWFRTILISGAAFLSAVWGVVFGLYPPVALVLLIGGGYVFVIFHKPLLGTLMFVFTLGFMALLSLPITSDGLRFSTVILVTVLLLIILRGVFLKDRAILFIPFCDFLSLTVIIFTLIVIISLRNSQHLAISVGGIKKFLYCVFAYFLIVLNTRNKRQLDIVITCFVISGAIIGLMGIWEAGSDNIYKILHKKSVFGAPVSQTMEKISSNRINGLIADGDLHGMFMGVVFMLTFYLFLRAKTKIKKALYSLIAGVCVFNIVGAASRGAVLGFMVAFLVLWMIIDIPQKWQKLIAAVMVILLLGAIMVLLIPDLNIERLYSPPEGVSSRTIDLRQNNIILSYHMFMDKPLLGQGPDGFVATYNKYALRLPEARKVYFSTSLTLYTQVLAEHGLIGFSIFLLMLILLFKRLYTIMKVKDPEYRRLAMVLIAAFTGYSVSMLTSGHLVDQTYWLIIALSSALWLVWSKERLKEEKTPS